MIPDAPTSAPATINTLLFKMKPVVQAAIPEYEFNKEITTGMSAPPIGMTVNMPSNNDIKTKTIIKFMSVGFIQVATEASINDINMTKFSGC
jgi:hypothetical protein